jgi:hypothetical protein
LVLISWAIISLVALIAIRLARTAWRQRSLPEALMAAFFCGGAAGYALLMIPLHFPGDPALVLSFRAASATVLLLPGTTVVLFTWYVFRRDAGWARALAWSLATFAVATHVVVRWLAGPMGLEHVVSMEPGTSFYWLVTIVKASGFAWACVEASLYYRDAKKRVVLGLTEPLVANRFLLWAIWSGAATAMVVIRIVSAMLIDTTRADAVTPVPIVLSMFAAGLSCAGAVWLTFAPPEFYRRFVERSQPMPATTQRPA